MAPHIHMLIHSNQKGHPKNHRDIFSSSFSDGNELNILELKSKERKISLEDHLYIKSFNFDNETNEYFYKLAFNSSKDLKNFKATINNDKTISIINFEII